MVRTFEKSFEKAMPIGDSTSHGQGTEQKTSSSFVRWHTGEPALDHSLPNESLHQASLHEVTPSQIKDGVAATGFCAALLVRLLVAMRQKKPALWCVRGFESREQGALYAPGLQTIGIDPRHIIIVQVERDEDALWVMEEGLKSGALSAVVGEVANADLTATRRLLLACEKMLTPAILLRPAGAYGPSAAYMRWKIENNHAQTLRDEYAGITRILPAVGVPSWAVELTRCRGPVKGGWPQVWNMEWNYAESRFNLAPPMANRSSATSKIEKVAYLKTVG